MVDLLSQAMWLTRLHEAQEKYKEACKKLYNASQPDNHVNVPTIFEELQDKLTHPKSTKSPPTQRLLGASTEPDRKLVILPLYPNLFGKIFLLV